MTFGIALEIPKTACIIPETTIQCRSCKTIIELDSKICVDYYHFGIIGIVCPKCGNFSQEEQ